MTVRSVLTLSKFMLFDFFEQAKENKFAIGAFNFSNMEQLRAIVQAAENMKAPVLVSTSEGESGFMGKEQAKALVDSWRRKTSVPLALHLDHGKSFAVIKEAVMAGYDSVHFDGSNLSWEENLEMTRQIVRWAKRYDVFVEGELGYLRGGSEVHEVLKIKKDDLTEPGQAAEFVEATGVDSLAVAVGNIHGVSSGEENPSLFLDRLSEISEKVKKNAFLVLHGGSGTPEEDIKEAVKSGIAKVNVNTELRVAYTETLKKTLKQDPKQTTPYKIMPPVVDAVQKVVEEKIKLFGSNNKI